MCRMATLLFPLEHGLGSAAEKVSKLESKFQEALDSTLELNQELATGDFLEQYSNRCHYHRPWSRKR